MRAGDFGRPCRGLDVVAVHKEHAAAGHHVGRHVVGVSGKPCVAIPQHGTVPGARIDQDDSAAGTGTGDCRRRQHHTFALEAGFAAIRKMVVAESSDVARPESEARTTDHGRRDLAARQPDELVDGMLGVTGWKRRNANEQVEAVLPEPHDIEPAVVAGRQMNRQSHAAHANTADPARGC